MRPKPRQLPFCDRFAFARKLLVALSLFAGWATIGHAQTASYDASTRYLTLPSVQVLETIYTNVVLRLDSVTVLNLGSAVPQAGNPTASASYDPAQRTLTLSSVTIPGASYYGLVARMDSFVVLSVGDSTPAVAPAAPSGPYSYYDY